MSALSPPASLSPLRPALGWFGAAGAAAALLTGAAALAMTVRAPLEPLPLFLDLGQAPPAAPALAALAEAAPQVVDEAPDLAAPPAPMAEPAPLPVAAPAPPVPEAQTRPAPPLPNISQPAEVALPAPLTPEPPAPAPSPSPAPKAEAKTKPPEPEKPVQRKTKTVKANPPKAKPAQASAAGASAPQAASKASGGVATSPALYAKAVMKKVRATRKETGAGKGRVVVGFTVATSGALAGVQVLRSSGDSGLDQIALNHIRRAAPFPAPPEVGGRSFSFEFVGK